MLRISGTFSVDDVSQICAAGLTSLSSDAEKAMKHKGSQHAFVFCYLGCNLTFTYSADDVINQLDLSSLQPLPCTYSINICEFIDLLADLTILSHNKIVRLRHTYQ